MYASVPRGAIFDDRFFRREARHAKSPSTRSRRVASAEQEVGGLDVAVDDAALVHGVERLEQLGGAGGATRRRATARDQVFERAARLSWSV